MGPSSASSGASGTLELEGRRGRQRALVVFSSNLDSRARRIRLPEKLVDEGLEAVLHLSLPEELPHALAVVQHHVRRVLVGEEQVLQVAVGVVDELQVGAVLVLERRPAAADKAVHAELEAGEEGGPGAPALLIGGGVLVRVAAEGRGLGAPWPAGGVEGGDDGHVALPVVVAPEVKVREAVRPLRVWVAFAEDQLLAYGLNLVAHLRNHGTKMKPINALVHEVMLVRSCWWGCEHPTRS